MWKLKTQVKRNIPAGFPSLTVSRYSLIFLATNKDSLSIMTTLESFRVKVTRFGPRVWYHETCLTLWFSCNKISIRLNSIQQNAFAAPVLNWHRVSRRRTLQMFLNPINPPIPYFIHISKYLNYQHDQTKKLVHTIYYMPSVIWLIILFSKQKAF